MKTPGTTEEAPKDVQARPARFSYPGGVGAPPPPLSTVFKEQIGELPIFPKGDPSLMFLPIGPQLGGLNAAQLHQASARFRSMIGFPPGTQDGPLLWHVESPTRNGQIPDRLCKMLVDGANAPRVDTMSVAVHFNTTDVKVAELALGRLAAADVLLQWPRPELSSAPPPPPVKVRSEITFCTTGRFLLYLPPGRVKAMTEPSLEPTDPVVNAILAWVHNAYNSSAIWVADEAGVEYVIEPCVGGAMSQRMLYMQLGSEATLAQLALCLDLPTTEVSRRALVLPTLVYPPKYGPVRRCTSKVGCWAMFWDANDAAAFACQSSVAQVQGQSPNAGFGSCFAADAEGSRSHLPGRMISAVGPVLVIQQPIRFILGNLLGPGQHSAETAAELVACHYGHVVPEDYLPPGYQDGADFLC